MLIFGSVTCPPFRRALEGIDEVYRDFRDRAEFLFVYIREAHPDSVLSLVDERGAPQDGFLQLHDIYNLRLPADLVVLSACQSGLGAGVGTRGPGGGYLAGVGRM